MADARNLTRLEQCIADARDALEQARQRHGWAGSVLERERMLALLAATLKALEARKAEVMRASR